MTRRRRPALVGAFATFAFFTLFAGQAWRNLLGWWGFGIVAAVVVVGAIVLLVRTPVRWDWRRVPKSTLAFLLIATASLAWSAYPAATALGLAYTFATVFVAVVLALCLEWDDLSAHLAAAFKWILALSLAFEAWVAVVVGGPLLPNFPTFDTSGDLPMAFYWSRGLLFEGGPIEGIVANRNLLGMVALLAAIVFAVRLASGSMHRGRGIAWLVVAGVVLVLTRSATVLLVAVLGAAVLAFALWARRTGPLHRRRVYWTAAVAGVASVVLLATGWRLLLAAFGKSDDVTGRIDIWASVIGLAAERPIAGWGWVAYWNPLVEPFDDLAVRKGVTYLQAHDAWLDVWMQLGIIGLLAFASVAIGALWRSWFLAVDPPMDGTGTLRGFSPAALGPILLMAALLGQSLAESRLLLEGNLALLIVIAWSTKQRQWHPEPLPAVPYRRFDAAGPR